jgi:predicted negative regulator of RcsB-dependent stress response
MVDDYLSDREQEEALRNWWRENWRWIFGGVVLGLALLAGWRYWQTHTTQRAEQAAAVYAEFEAAGNDAEKAQAAFDRLTSEFARSPYTLYARLLKAKSHVEAGEFDEAAAQLRVVVKDSKDDELERVAQIRLARVLIQQQKPDEALSLLKAQDAGAFTAQVREVRGDALFATGDLPGARAEYAAALAANAETTTDRAMLELKLQQTGGGAAATAPVAVPASSTDPETDGAAPAAEGQP